MKMRMNPRWIPPVDDGNERVCDSVRRFCIRGLILITHGVSKPKTMSLVYPFRVVNLH
jgi:hypothetical protein